jgi:hypothetical protein
VGGMDGGTETSFRERSTASWEGLSRTRCAACVHLSARSVERTSAVRIRSPTTVRARIKEGRGIAPVRPFSRSGSSSPGWLARSFESGCGSPRKAYETEGQDPEQSEGMHKDSVRRSADIGLASTTVSGSVSEGSNPGPAAPYNDLLCGAFHLLLSFYP